MIVRLRELKRVACYARAKTITEAVALVALATFVQFAWIMQASDNN